MRDGRVRGSEPQDLQANSVDVHTAQPGPVVYDPPEGLAPKANVIAKDDRAVGAITTRILL